MATPPHTHEREITEPVELCRPDGRTLNPAAVGWSRQPLHTANLRGGWGRTKRWDYWCILSRHLVIAITYADVDPTTGISGGHEPSLPFARGVSLPETPGTAALTHHGRSSAVELVDDAFGTTIIATWDEAGTAARLDLRIDLPPGHESLNVVIPWSQRRFQYTSKHQARPTRGTLTIGDQVRTVGGDRPEDEAWGVLDVGRGRWPYSTRWNWGGGAGRSDDGTVIGLQFGAKWTEGTGFTENGVIVDGRLTKIGDELNWSYDWKHPMRPWRVRRDDGSLDVTLTATYDRHTRVNALLLATEVHQVFGTWAGHVTADDGTTHRFDQLSGFAEESRSRW